VDHAGDALFVQDLEQGTIVDVNRQACESLGYTRQELIGDTAVAFHLESDRAGIESAAKRAATGETVVDTHYHRRKDGTVFPVEASTSSFWYGGQRFLLHVSRDITERLRAEEAVRQSEKQLRDVIEGIPAIASTIRLDGSVEFMNRRWQEYTGMSSEASVGLGWRSAGHPKDIDHYVEKRRAALASGDPFEDEVRIRSRNGEYRWFLLRGVPLRDERGNIVRWYATAIDIDDRKRAEEQRERLRQLEADLAHIDRVSLLGELAASIAHEVNQPLSGVVSNGSACLRWLAGDAPNLEEAREAARRIVRDGKRAGEVIARIRALTKKAVAPREKLNLNETIRGVLALVGDEAKRNTVVIRTRFGDDLFSVLGDQVQLQQVALNLVMNAIEAMSKVGDRARELVITTRNIDPDQVLVTVEDSGTGIDPQMIDKIFDSFYTTKPSGMGMGLSISRSILQAHGGRLWATAKDGAGTIFHFTLPKYHEAESHEGAAGT
jgi:PAS domain S-box-containing protein